MGVRVSEVLITSDGLSSAQKLTVTTDFLNNISTGMLFRDAHGILIDCNQAAEEILGTTREHLLGIEGRVVRPDGAPYSPARQRFSPPCTRDNLSSKKLTDIIVPDGRQKWVMTRHWPANVDGEIVGVLTAFNDITREVKERAIPRTAQSPQSPRRRFEHRRGSSVGVQSRRQRRTLRLGLDRGRGLRGHG